MTPESATWSQPPRVYRTPAADRREPSRVVRLRALRPRGDREVGRASVASLNAVRRGVRDDVYSA